jgi:hypothetical protein
MPCAGPASPSARQAVAALCLRPMSRRQWVERLSELSKIEKASRAIRPLIRFRTSRDKRDGLTSAAVSAGGSFRLEERSLCLRFLARRSSLSSSDKACFLDFFRRFVEASGVGEREGTGEGGQMVTLEVARCNRRLRTISACDSRSVCLRFKVVCGSRSRLVGGRRTRHGFANFALAEQLLTRAVRGSIQAPSL